MCDILMSSNKYEAVEKELNRLKTKISNEDLAKIVVITKTTAGEMTYFFDGCTAHEGAGMCFGAAGVISGFGEVVEVES